MAAAKGHQPLIIKKVRKGGHGHHGGAWKVAYADFVTAMMAFFLLLWLLNAVSQQQLEGISDYFAPISMQTATSGGGGLMAGKEVARTGTFDTDVPQAGAAALIPSAALKRVDNEDRRESELVDGKVGEVDGKVSEQALAQELKRREEEQFQKAEKEFRNAVARDPMLKQLSGNLVVDDTPEGLRIQLIDQDGLPMFPRGDTTMYAHTRRLIELVARVIKQMPQNIDITGHTDAVKFANDGAYGNWELSADRANAARRALLEFGVGEERIARVVGKAARDPLVPEDPQSPANRRLSIVLLRGTVTQLN